MDHSTQGLEALPMEVRLGIIQTVEEIQIPRQAHWEGCCVHRKTSSTWSIEEKMDNIWRDNWKLQCCRKLVWTAGASPALSLWTCPANLVPPLTPPPHCQRHHCLWPRSHSAFTHTGLLRVSKKKDPEFAVFPERHMIFETSAQHMTSLGRYPLTSLPLIRIINTNIFPNRIEVEKKQNNNKTRMCYFIHCCKTNWLFKQQLPNCLKTFFPQCEEPNSGPMHVR